MADTTAAAQDSKSISIEEKSNIRSCSQLFVGKGKSLSTYHTAMNKAAEELCLKNPSLLWQRGTLLENARKVVNESGYIYKKGQSRSKSFNPPTESSSSAKRPKVGAQEREKRIADVAEDLKDISDRMSFNDKRRVAAESSRNYKLCDELTEEKGSLKARKRELEAEMAALTKKSKRAEKYKKKGSSSGSASVATPEIEEANASPLPSGSDEDPMEESEASFLADRPPASPRDQEGN